MERAAEFLANEIKVVQNIDEGKRLVFFVSAKEMLNNTVNPERADSWSQFCDFIELCLNTTEQGCRYVTQSCAGSHFYGIDDKIWTDFGVGNRDVNFFEWNYWSLH